MSAMPEAIYWKPVQAGTQEETDTETVARLSECAQERILPEAYRLTQPLSPHLSARLDGIEIQELNLALPATEQFLIVETAGGVLVPLRDDLLQIEMIQQWQLPVLLASRSALGTINHTLLTLQALRSRDIPLLGVVVIGPSNPENERAIEQFGDIPIVGRIPELPALNHALLLATYREHFQKFDFRQSASSLLPHPSYFEESWLDWDAEHIWHPYTQMQLLPYAIGVDRAEGSYIYLSDGRKVFDGISSWWVTLHGHAHPKIARAIAEQASKLEQVIFAGFTHEPAATLAHKLIERAPAGLAKVFFSDDGSTAVEVALKIAIQYWKHLGEDRRTFLALEHAYHGDTFGAMSVSARSSFTAAFDPLLFNVRRLPFPDAEREEHFLSTLELECVRPDVAAFIYEPLLLGAGGMKTWRATVMNQAIQIARKHGVLAIADEVLTGFGRTGTFFASEQASAKPDIMTLSKGITGGFLPLGTTLATQEIYNAFLSEDRAKTFFHGHSYTGNPLACAAAVASLNIFEEEPVMERIATIARVHEERLPALADSLGYVHRKICTVAALEPRRAEGYLSDRSRTLAARALERGLLVRPLGDTVYLLPPYSSTAEGLHRAYDILEECLTSPHG